MNRVERRKNSPSNSNGVPSSRDRRRKTGGGQAPGALVTRLAVAAAAAVVTASRVLPRASEEVILRREHRVVQIILQVIRRRRQVSRDFGGASHWPWYRYHRRRRTACRRFRQRLRRGQGCRAHRIPAVRSSRRQKEESGGMNVVARREYFSRLFLRVDLPEARLFANSRVQTTQESSLKTLGRLGTLPARP